MRKVVFILFFHALLLGLLNIDASAQNKTNAYYDSHPSEIFLDAQAAFRNGDYDRTVELCRLHYIIIGDSRADNLREKASECARLTNEMNSFVSGGRQDAAREKAREILVLNPDDRKAKDIAAFVSRGTINGHEWVDLGLPSGLKWATCNVGASSPEEYGDYFAWGETRPKREYNWVSYRYRVSGDSNDNVSFGKYNTTSDRGSVDNKTQLAYSDDAARANWGGSWRMPTDTEWEELRSHCNRIWTTQGGKNGYSVTSKTNGNSIFLPAAGYRYNTGLGNVGSDGYYWSSSLSTDFPYTALHVNFNSGFVYECSINYRFLGFSVRPVTE